MPKENVVANAGKTGQIASAEPAKQAEKSNVMAVKPVETATEKPAEAEKPVEAEKPADSVVTEKPADSVVEEKSTETAPSVETAEKPVEVAYTGFAPDLLDILATSKSRSSGGGIKIRPNIGYTLVTEKLKVMVGTAVPEQEQVILKILNRALTPAKPIIMEPELNKLILAAYETGALKTKQDAWHIFRYYRTDLKKRGVLREIEVQLAS